MEITYGGVLNSWQSVPADDAGLLRAAKFAVSFIQRRQPDKVPLDDSGNVQHYELTKCTQLKIIVTKDEVTPVMVQQRNPATGQSELAPVVLGLTWSFTVHWPSLADNRFSHRFTVTENDQDGGLYMYEHTFVLDTDKPEGQGQRHCSSEDTSLCGQDVEEARPSRASSVSPSGSKTFSILSYNIWNTNAVNNGSKVDYAGRVAHMGQLMQLSNADIIGFQEVRLSEGKGDVLGPNQVEHLATYLREYNFVFQPAQIQSHFLPSRSEEGVAIFSKFPIVDHDYLLLSRDKNDSEDIRQRVLLRAEILVPSLGRIHVFNTHLSLSERARQTCALQMWKHMSTFKEPVVFMGDLNAEKYSDEMLFLVGKKELKDTSTKDFHDVWQLKYGDADDGLTYSTLEDEFLKRIDYVFMRDHPDVEFRDVNLLDDGTRKDDAASDHLGVLAEFATKKQDPK